MTVPFARRLWAVAAFAAIASLVAVSALPAAAQEPIKIGLVLPLGGPSGEYVKRYVAAPVEFAAKEINDAGGIRGRPIRVITEDTRLDPASAVSALRKLADVDQVLAVVTSFTPLTLPQLPVAEQKQIILLAPSVEHPNLTKSPWAVRMTWTAEKSGIAIARVASKLGLRTAVVLAEDNEAIRLTERAFKAEFEKSGGRLVATETIKMTDTDMRGQLTKLRAERAEALYVMVSSGRPMAVALRQAAEVGFRPKQLFTNHLIEDREVKAIGGGVGEGAIYTTTDIDPEFSRRFTAALNYAPDANAGKHYDAAKLLFESIRRAGTADDRVKVRDTLYNFGDYKGVAGTFTFRGSGEPGVEPTIKTLKGGEYVRYGG